MHENVMHIYKKYKKWNQSYYPACLESVQEGKVGIRYQFRQHSIVTNSTDQGNQPMYFFKVFEYQVHLNPIYGLKNVKCFDKMKHVCVWSPQQSSDVDC